MVRLFALSLLLPLATPVVAQTEVKPATPAVKVQKEKKLCRREIATGSMMAKSTCHTRSEWAAIDAANEGHTVDFRNGMNQGAGGSVR